MTKYERAPFSNEMLRSFTAIAEHQHLTVAAHELNLTQSALSVHLRKMEAGLGTQLFERHARGMKLTVDGAKLLPVAHHILSELGRVRSMFAQPLRGKVKVGIPDHYDDMIFETALVEFSRAYPEVDMTVTSGCTSGFAKEIEAGRLDIAVVNSIGRHSGEILETEATHWVEGDGFEYRPEDPLPLAVLDRDCWWSEMPGKALTEHDRAFNIKFRSESFSNLRCAIRAGLAIGVLPARAVQQGMRIADKSRNLPALPAVTHSFLFSATAPQDVVQEMASKLRDGICKPS